MYGEPEESQDNLSREAKPDFPKNGRLSSQLRETRATGLWKTDDR